MKILITGAAGYIGSVLTPLLLERYPDCEITAVDNFMYGQASLNQLAGHPRFDVVNCDWRQINRYRIRLGKADYIIHLAALVGAPACDRTQDSYSVNGIIPWELDLRSAQRILYPNTNSGYGASVDEVTEESPFKPLSAYGVQKVRTEQMIMERENSISLRLATVFGASPRMRIDLMVNDFVYRAVTDKSLVLFEPHFRRNFIHVRDVCRAFIRAIDNWDFMKGNVYNVGLSSANLTKAQLCEKIAQHVPGFTWFVSPTGEDPDKRDYVVSNRKIEAAGWQPVVSLDDGIKELIRLYRMISNRRYGNV